ncbi:hypothetical protein ACQ4PT_027487 [Festuca glaucescens]
MLEYSRATPSLRGTVRGIGGVKLSGRGGGSGPRSVAGDSSGGSSSPPNGPEFVQPASVSAGLASAEGTAASSLTDGPGSSQTWRDGAWERPDGRDPPPSVNGAASSAVSCVTVPAHSGPIGWKRRPRGPAVPEERPSSVGRVAALEASLRGFAARQTDVVVNPAMGTVFDSLPEAYELYNLYSWESGFGIRYGKSRHNVRGSKCMQEIVCGCVGKPVKDNSSSTRTNCPALVRLLRTDDHGWFVSEHRVSHNHPLLRTCAEKLHCCHSHKHIDKYTRVLVKQLRDNNVNLSKVYIIIGSLFRRVENVSFTKRCLRNFCGKLSREQADDDVRKTMEVFSQIGAEDPDSSYVVEVDKDSKIKTLLWTNGRSKLQYHNFGDAITFDATYRTNLYDMPFGLFVGVNNHFLSIILGGVLMREEKIASFKWLFCEFIKMMGGRHPKTIPTDQARAMEVAIQQVMPDTTHRWCKWHVLRKAKESLGAQYTKWGDFQPEFHKVLNSMLIVQEFETDWLMLVDKYKLQNNAVMTQIYEVRHKWGKPYFSGKFCAKMTSTQRCESANHLLKGYVPPGCPMNLFVKQYSKIQFDRESEEGFQEKRTRLGGVVLQYNLPLEEHASKVYTRTMFEMFESFMYKAGRYILVEELHGRKYVARQVNGEARERWCKPEYIVEVSADRGKFNCECGLFAHMDPSLLLRLSARKSYWGAIRGGRAVELEGRFRAAFALLCLCDACIFNPVGGKDAPIGLSALMAVRDPSKITQLNWRRHALDILFDGARKAQQAVQLGADTFQVNVCWIIPQVVCFDMMQEGRGHLHREALYEEPIVRYLISRDKANVSIGRFKDYGKGRVRRSAFLTAS